ncbi:MAG: glycosyltransferase [Candidatus Alcyoniella australis]|nr:glycosyltransferase [Candidatus Alcyoniella australis]
MSRLPQRPMYLTAGNFPSIAANTIQVAKMSAAYSKLLPNLSCVALCGMPARIFQEPPDLQQMYGLSGPLDVRYLPLLPFQRTYTFNREYRPPKWFYNLAARYARSAGADLVFTRKPETAIVAVRLGLPTILETHIHWEQIAHLHKYRELFCQPQLLAIVVVVDVLKQGFIEAGIAEDRLIVEPDAADLELYRKPLSKSEARSELGLDADDFLCVYTGHLYRDRGIELIIEVAKRLAHVRFLIVGGWDEDVRHYRNLSQRQGVTNVRFSGFVDNGRIPIYQFAADALLMQYSAGTHHAERCSPIKLFEYLAAGRPIIATDLPVLTKVLHDRQNALLVESDSVDSLVDAIELLRNDSGLAQRLADCGCRSSTQYGWQQRAARILDRALPRWEALCRA